MTFIYSRAAIAVNRHIAGIQHAAGSAKRDARAGCPDGWICSDDFTDDHQLFSSAAPDFAMQQRPPELTHNANGLMFQKDGGGTWQFTRLNPPVDASVPDGAAKCSANVSAPQAQSATIVLIASGPRRA